MVEGNIDQETGKLKTLYYEVPGIAIWKSMTRVILKHHSVSELINCIGEVISEASEEQWFDKKWLEDGSFKKKDYDYKQPQKKSVIKLNLKNEMIKKKINDNLKIIDVAKSYGIIIKGKKCSCPFHKEKEPSLTFYEKTNTFKCYGCQAKGNIIEFIRRMEDEISKS